MLLHFDSPPSISEDDVNNLTWKMIIYLGKSIKTIRRLPRLIQCSKLIFFCKLTVHTLALQSISKIIWLQNKHSSPTALYMWQFWVENLWSLATWCFVVGSQKSNNFCYHLISVQLLMRHRLKEIRQDFSLVYEFSHIYIQPAGKIKGTAI